MNDSSFDDGALRCVTAGHSRTFGSRSGRTSTSINRSLASQEVCIVYSKHRVINWNDGLVYKLLCYWQVVLFIELTHVKGILKRIFAIVLAARTFSVFACRMWWQEFPLHAHVSE